MKRTRITVQLNEKDKEKIHCVIKAYYPKLKTVSDVVREALSEFLARHLGEAKP